MRSPHTKFLILSLLCISCLFSCKKNDEVIIDDKKAFVETLNALTNQAGGVQLNGRLNLSENFSEFGFIVSMDSALKDTSTHVVKLSGKLNEFFSKDIKYGLEANTKYYFKAYVKKDSTVYAGLTKQFVYGKDKPMIIEKITPGPFHLGDTIMVKGKNFNTDLYGTRILFKGEKKYVEAPIINISDSLINFVIPYEVKEASVQFEIADYIRTAIITDRVPLAKPVISSVTPLIINLGDTVTITGDHFEKDLRYLTLYNNAIDPVKIISASSKLIKAVINSASSSTIRVSVISQNQRAEYNELIKLYPFTIVQKAVSVKYGDEVTIYGKNLQGPSQYFYDLNSFMFAPLEITGNYVKLKIPYSAFPHRDGQINISANGRTLTYNDIRITNKWYWASLMPFVPASLYNTFKLNNEVYVFSYNHDEYNHTVFLYKFNPANYKWTAYNIPTATVAAATANGRIFLFTEYGELFEFSNNTAVKIGDFPRHNSSRILVTGDGNKVYVIYDFGATNSTMSFHIYDAATNKWEEKYAPGKSFGPASKMFTINKILYVLDYYNDLWQYNSNSDSWIKKSKSPIDAPSSNAVFVYNNKAYIAMSTIPGYIEKCLIYNPQNDTWTNTGNTIDGNHYGTVGFELDGQFYYGGYRGGINIYFSDLIQTEAF